MHSMAQNLFLTNSSEANGKITGSLLQGHLQFNLQLETEKGKSEVVYSPIPTLTSTWSKRSSSGYCLVVLLFNILTH